MKPYNIGEARVPIELGDVVFVKERKQLFFVDEIRHNRRRYDETTAKGATTADITLNDLVGNIPNRFVRFNAVGIIETDAGHISDIKRGAQGMLSDVNVTHVELDEDTCGDEGGGDLRFGALPLDYWSFATEDEYIISIVTDVAEKTLTVVLDVTEYKCSQKALPEFEKKGLPDTIVFIGYFGTRRMSSKDFEKLQQWL